MPASERRDSLIAAARPLLFSEGRDFTTKQVAKAAGVAEGTIFRVFASKQELLEAVVEDVLDPGALVAALDAMPDDPTLDARVKRIIGLLHHNLDDVRQFFAALRAIPAHGKGPHAHPAPEHSNAMHSRQMRSAQLSHAAIERGLAPFADQMTINPSTAAAYLRAMTLTISHPFMMSGAPTMSPNQLGDLLVHGMKKEA